MYYLRVYVDINIDNEPAYVMNFIFNRKQRY